MPKEDISTQFYANAIHNADFVDKFFDDAEELKNKVPYQDQVAIPLFFWAVGPIQGKSGVFVWGDIGGKSGTCGTKEVISINKIQDSCHVMVLAKDRFNSKTWYDLDLNKSAFAFARSLDMFLHNAYTDIVPVSTDCLSD